MDPSLVEQIVRAQRGDASAFDVIVAAYETRLVRFVAALLGGDGHAAADVVQDVFVAAWDTLPALESPHHLRAWLYRVAYRRGISWMRRRGPRGTPFLDIEGVGPEGERVAANVPDRGASPERRCEEAEELPHLRAVLAGLPPHYAAPVTLYYVEERSLREVALLLDVPLPTLKMRLHRARRLLRTYLCAQEPWQRKTPRGATRPRADLRQDAEAAARQATPVRVEPEERP